MLSISPLSTSFSFYAHTDMATLQEVEVVISKILSDKAKLREEGVKELLSYLEASGGVSLCPILDRQSAVSNHSDKLLSSTWAGVIRALCQCNKMEYTSSKRKAPKLIFSKALRNAIQKVEERIRSGASLFFPQDLRNLFSHLLDGIIEVPSFLPDYSHVVCQLVTISDYCSQMTRQVYAKFVVFFLEKVKSLVDENAPKASIHVEEAFRMVLVLQSLLQNPPDHFMEKVRDLLIEGFSYIFLNLRGEGRVAKKLLASVNMLLLKDGVNLGDLLIDLHNNMKNFVTRTWKMTRDRELKDELVLYGRLQLKLRTVVIFSEGEFIDQMLQLVLKELDQACAVTFLSGSYRTEGGRDCGKCGHVTMEMYYFLEFAASILFQASLDSASRSFTLAKKQKRDDIFVTLSERLKNGNPLWWGSFCFLVRSHSQGISIEVIYRWLKDLSIILERSLSEVSTSTQNFETLVWILRFGHNNLWTGNVIFIILVEPIQGLLELHLLMALAFGKQSKSLWESIWIMVLQWIPLFSGTSILVEESFKLLGHVLMQNILPKYPVSQEFWALKPFTEAPCRSILFFLASFFSNSAQQIPRFEDQLWKKLLTWIVLSPDKQEHMQLKIAAILALSTGCVPQSSQFSRSKSSRLSDELDDWAKVEQLCKNTEKDLILLDEITNYYSEYDTLECYQLSRIQQARNKPFSLNRTLLKELAEDIVKKVCILTETKTQDILEQLLIFASVIMACVSGVLDLLQRRGQYCQEWSSEGIVYQALSSVIDRCALMVKEFSGRLMELSSDTAVSSWLQSISGLDLPNVRKCLSMLLFSQYYSIELVDNTNYSMISSTLLENLLLAFEILFKSSRNSLKTVDASGCKLHPDIDYVNTKSADGTSFDADFDVDGNAINYSINTDDFIPGTHLSPRQMWMMDCVTIITLFAQSLPERTCHILSSLLHEEDDPLVRREIILSLCRSAKRERLDHVASLIDDIGFQYQTKSTSLESSSHFVLTAIDTLFETLLSSKEIQGADGSESKCTLSEKVFRQVAKLLNDVSQNTLLFWHLKWKFAEAIQKLNDLEPSATEILLDKFLSMLHDIDYRVRWIMSRMVEALFQVYTGHEDLFQDICSNFSLKMIMATKEKTITASEVSLTSKDRCHAETALITLAEVAAVSEKVEVEAVFMICANAAIFPALRFLSRVSLDRLARKFLYPNRWKYLSHHLCSIFSFWFKVQLPLPALVEVRDLMVCNLDPVDFLNYCCQWVLPSLLIYNNDRELEWLAKMINKSIPDLVREFSAAIFSALLPLYSHGDGEGKRIAVSVLQGKMLTLANISEDDRDMLIRKNMVSIVNGILQLCSSSEEPVFPLFSKKDIMSSLHIVVDGFCGSSERNDDEMIEVKDMLKIFRADRVFMFLLQIHLQIESAYHSRHRRAKLAGLACLVEVIKKSVAVPITCRYIFHILLRSLKMQDLHEICCQIAGDILDTFSRLPKEVSCQVLGPELQLIVSHCVSICVELCENDKITDATTSPVYALLERIMIHGGPSIHGHMKELPPFPDLPCFGRIRMFHSKLCGQFNVVFDFEKYVMMLSEFPCSLQLKSLQNLHRVFAGNKSGFPMNDEHVQAWSSKKRLVVALLKFVRLCLDYDDIDVFDLAGDFIARMEIEDPHAVVVGLRGNTDLTPVVRGGYTSLAGIDSTCSITDDLSRMMLRQLKNYLIDEDVLIIELAAQTLKGLLATEKGQSVLKSMEGKETAYINVFSRGVNPNTVGNMLNILKAESTKKSIPLEDELLWNVSQKGYDAWVCLLVYSLIHYCEDTMLRLCQGIVHCKVPFAESLLPHVLGSLATTTGVNSNICKLISSQVDRHVFCEENRNTRSIQLFLDALNELRHCDVLAHMKLGEEHKKKMSNAKVYWLDIDYLKTAKAAHQCGAYFTSVLYIEHWCEEQFGRLTLGEPNFSDDEELPIHVELLLDVYSRINEPDGVYGVVQSDKLMPQVLISEHEGNWSRAVEGYDLLIRNKDIRRSTKAKSIVASALAETNIENLTFADQFKYNKGLIRSLQQTGCDHVLKMYCRGLSADKESLERNGEFQELQYESAWRAGNWDFYHIFPKMEDKFDALELPVRINFHSSLYCCLQALYDGDHGMFFSQMKVAKKELVKLISMTSLESASNIFPSVIKLQILDSLCKSWGLRWKHVEEPHQKKEKLLGPYVPSVDRMAIFDHDWKKRLGQMQYQFDLFEPYVAFHKVLHQILGCEESIPHQILEFAIFARKAGRINQAAAAIYELKQYYKDRRTTMGSSDEKIWARMSASVKVEEAKVLWAQGQHEIAVNLLKYVISHCHVHEDSASVYCLTGKWLAETHSDSSRIILTEYLHKAVELFQSIQQNHSSKYVELKSRACFRLAHYADSLYRSYKERLSSSEWQNALRLRKHREKEVEMLRRKLTDTLKTWEKRESAKKGAQDERIDYAKKVAELQKQLAMDNEEAQRLQNDKDSFLKIALESYLCCLATADKYDLRVVFKITSLWFNLLGHKVVIESMLEIVKQVKSYKFLPLVYQIASRLGPFKDTRGMPSFQYALASLLKKMAVEHPYHTVYQLLALSNVSRIKDKQRSKAAFIIDLDKKQAAESLLNELMFERKEIIQQMKQLVEIYIRLAEIEVKKEDMNKKLTLPRDVRSVRQLELVPVITAPIPVSPDAAYPEGSFPYFKGLSDRVTVMMGINTPKVVECLGSDGRHYRQLAKSGNDDLRQDAVMEQLFSLVNNLLQHHPDTRRRKLGIRTYKVVPFTPSAGVLEWVDGTIPLGEYLLGSNRIGGAHARYRQGDWPFPTCRKYMLDAHDKQSAYQLVCENFRPVFHYFFLEKFSHPAEWFSKRLAYTRSVAASSMVGYIVGLGDRHAMNILIDQQTAEVVHIDLGVAFEQGLMLKMPERVPFRLTRDVVDGMGVTGVDGVFRRCCEETLTVMRTNKDALLTIIEVFIHDPLYNWALSPLKALQRQKDFEESKDETAEVDIDGEASEGNRDAARALMRVKQKLDGYEGGDIRSVHGQVQQLIQDAQDSDKLCQMFPGWGAWL